MSLCSKCQKKPRGKYNYYCPDCNREYQREWAIKNRISQTKYARKLRTRVITLLGKKCVYCGCDVVEALEINHRSGGGHQEFKKINRSKKGWYLDILSGRRTIEDLELTCRICNAHHYLTQIKDIKDDWTITWKS